VKRRVFLNVASSVDGRIASVGREKFRFASAEDKRLMQELRCVADAVVIGAGTLRDEDPVLVVRDADLLVRRRAEKPRLQPLQVLVTRNLDVPVEGSRFFGAEDVERLVFTGPDVAPARLAAAGRHATVIAIPEHAPGELDLSHMLEALEARGCREILVEGGGALNFALLDQDLVDDLYLTLCPVVLGGPAPGSFAGRGFLAAAARRLTLVTQRTNAHGEIFLHYRVVR